MRGVVDTLRNTDSNAMRRFAEQVPQESNVGAWDRRGNVRGSVPQTYGKYLRARRGGEQGWAER